MTLEFRPWQCEDAAALMKIMNTVDRQFLSDRLPYPYTERDAADWLRRVLEQEGKSGCFRAIVGDGYIVGMISVEQSPQIAQQTAEMSYCLVPEMQGRGIMTRAVEHFCPVAFSELGLAGITAEVIAENRASRKVLEKNGFTLQNVMPGAMQKQGSPRDLCVYRKEKVSCMRR